MSTLTQKDHLGRPPLGWLVEPKGDGAVYLTLKLEVAEKRHKAKDYVTPMYSQKPEHDPEEL